MRRTAADLYPKFLTFSDAFDYYSSIPPVRGHGASTARPLARGRRTNFVWCIALDSAGDIVCTRHNQPIITYYKTGFVRITPTASAAYELAVIRAVAPVDTAQWNYYKNHLAVRVGGRCYTCAAGDARGILLPPLDLETSFP